MDAGLQTMGLILQTLWYLNSSTKFGTTVHMWEIILMHKCLLEGGSWILSAEVQRKYN